MDQITAENLLAFRRCRRLPYLDRYGPPAAQVVVSDFVQHLRQDRQRFRQAIATDYPGVMVPADAPDRAQATLDQIAQGTERIYGGMLKQSLIQIPGLLLGPDDPLAATLAQTELVTYPDLLVRVGERQYRPVEIRTGKRVKPDYELRLALNAEVLSYWLGNSINHGSAVVRDGRWHRLTLLAARRQARLLLRDYLTMLATTTLPEVYMARSRCGLCAWQQYCHQLAAQDHPLTLLPGVTTHRYLALQAAGIHTVAALAATPSPQLQQLPGIGERIAQQLIQQAQATSHQKPLATKPYQIPQAPVELYFDIEADPDHQVAYLLGVLVVDHTQGREDFYPCLAESPEQEAEAWQAFLAVVERYPTAPIFHFHGFEVTTCRQLAQAYGTPRPVLQALLARFVDLHPIISQCWVLPVESYSLKHVCRWLGFQWRQPKSGGAQAIFWYAQWLQTGDRHWLQAAVDYNEDDCQATYRLKQWLASQQIQALAARPRLESVALEAPWQTEPAL